MSEQEIRTTDLTRTAYELAWKTFAKLPGLTPDERMNGPDKLRWYIGVLVEIGERDSAKIAQLALGMIREYEQIMRSKARVTSSPKHRAAA